MYKVFLRRSFIAAGKVITCISVISLMSGLSSLAVAKDEAFKPRIEGEATIEFQADKTFKSDDSDNKISDTYNTTSLGVGWYFSRYFSTHGSFVLEPVEDPQGDRFFKDHGLYVEELYAKFNLGKTEIVAGKFNPAFGKAWDETPGLYGTDFAENYELTERLGFSVGTQFDKTTLGTLAITASVYYMDRSALSNSIFTERGRLTSGSGGAGNTGELNNFAVAVEGSDLPYGLRYNLGYRFQRAGVDGVSDENGYVFGLAGETGLGSTVLEWISEIAYIDNADGSSDDELYLTFGGNFKFKDDWELAISYTGISRDQGADDHLFQTSVSTEIYQGWRFGVGYKNHIEDDISNHTAGIKLEKTIEFGTGK